MRIKSTYHIHENASLFKVFGYTRRAHLDFSIYSNWKWYDIFLESYNIEIIMGDEMTDENIPHL